VVRYYLAFVGVVLLAGAAWLFLRRASLALHGAFAQGWIEDFDVRTGADGTTFFPIVAFVDESGNRHRFTALAGAQERGPDVGTVVPVRYLREHPERACIQSFLQMWAAPFALAVLGGGALLALLRSAR